MTLHLCPDIVGIFGEEDGNSGIIRSNILDASIATSKTAPLAPIDYLIPQPKPTTLQQSSVENETNPTVTLKDPNEKADSPKTLSISTTKCSEEDTLNNRSEKSSED